MSKCKGCQHPDRAKFTWLIHDCPNMKMEDDDCDMDREHYKCKVCGETDWLDYEEMR